MPGSLRIHEHTDVEMFRETTYRPSWLRRHSLVAVLCKLPVREKPSPIDLIFAVWNVVNVRVDQQIPHTDVSVHILAALVSVTVSYIIMSVRV